MIDYVSNLMKSKSTIINEVKNQPFSNLAAVDVDSELRLIRSKSGAFGPMH